VKEEWKNDMQLLFGKRMDHPLSPPCIYTPHQMRWVVFGGWFRCVLILVLVYLKPVFTPPSQLLKLIIFKKNKNCVAADAKDIGSENCVVADPEIGSKNCFAADAEIGSEN
jgi:hypothetical protein